MKIFLRYSLSLAVAIGLAQFWRPAVSAQEVEVLDSTPVSQDGSVEDAVLPPMPDLRPESKKTFQEKKAERKKETKLKKETRSFAPAPSGRSRAELLEEGDQQLLSRLDSARVEMVPGAEQSASDAEFMTPSGRRLQSFDDPGFWQEPGAPQVEPSLADLPPMPDLRSDDQKSRWELKEEREQKIEEVMARRDEAIATLKEQQKLGAEAARQKALEAASRPAPPEMQAYPYNGPAIQPRTPTNHPLRPYGEESRFVKDQRVVYSAEFQGTPVVNQYGYPASADQNESIGFLPEMPDLRSDETKSWWEKKRERKEKIAEVKARRDEAIAQMEEQRRLGQEAARQKALEAASRPAPPEPTYYPYDGQVLVVPETPTGKVLVPYGKKSRFIQNGQVVNPGVTE